MTDNQPLFGQAVPQDQTLAKLALKRSLAQQLLAGAGDTSPVGSPLAALNRAISPALGAWEMNRANKEGGDLYNQAAPILAQLAHSNDPAALAAASQNPLVRALLPQLVGDQMSDARALRTKDGEYKLAGQYEPQITGANAEATGAANLKYAPQIAGATTKATESAQFPYQKALAVLQQGPEYANLAETKRFHDLMAGGGFGGGTDFGVATDPYPGIQEGAVITQGGKKYKRVGAEMVEVP